MSKYLIAFNFFIHFNSFNAIIIITNCQPRIDLSAGQGDSAKACLEARVPFCGLVLSENHAARLEVSLTDHVLKLMRTEGSSHFRPDAVSDVGEGPEKPPKKRSTPGGGQPKPTKPPKQAKHNEEAGEGPKPKPPKKTKKEKKDDEEPEEGDSEHSSMPW